MKGIGALGRAVYRGIVLMFLFMILTDFEVPEFDALVIIFLIGVVAASISEWY